MNFFAGNSTIAIMVIIEKSTMKCRCIARRTRKDSVASKLLLCSFTVLCNLGGLRFDPNSGPLNLLKNDWFLWISNFETHPYFTKHSEMSPRLEGHGHDLSLYPIGGGEFPCQTGWTKGNPPIIATVLGGLDYLILNSVGNPPKIYIYTYIRLIYECKLYM